MQFKKGFYYCLFWNDSKSFHELCSKKIDNSEAINLANIYNQQIINNDLKIKSIYYCYRNDNILEIWDFEYIIFDTFNQRLKSSFSGYKIDPSNHSNSQSPPGEYKPKSKFYL